MYRLMLVLSIISLSACVPGPTPAAVSEPTQSLQVPVPSDWAGGITHADREIESVTIHLAETGGKLTIEPKTKTYKLADLQRSGPTLSFKVTLEDEMNFSGTFDGSQITGRVEHNGQTDSFTFLPLFTEPKDPLDQFLGTYQFESGASLLINLAPEYSSSGLYFFGQGLMVTHFGTGAIRALYRVARDTFLVGRARAIGYPFEEQIIFQRDPKGNVTGLSWQARDPMTG
ncbi:MAG TPA: hypothetical protein VK206_12535, partial [Anaerolineales bacterium]|nr:hypothetical protein [Anaerolineales bacterium]